MEGKGLAFTETVALTTSAAAVGVDALAAAGGGTLFATEGGGFDEAEAAGKVGCAGCGCGGLVADEKFEAGDELTALG
jgi:hypothetical protein